MKRAEYSADIPQIARSAPLECCHCHWIAALLLDVFELFGEACPVLVDCSLVFRIKQFRPIKGVVKRFEPVLVLRYTTVDRYPLEESDSIIGPKFRCSARANGSFELNCTLAVI